MRSAVRRPDPGSIFEYNLDGALPDAAYDGLRDATDAWSASWRANHRPVLKYWSAPGFLQTYDGRHAGHEGTYTFDGALSDIYLACTDRPTTAPAVSERLGGDPPVAAVLEAFEEFQRRGLMFLDGTLAVALAVPR